VENDHLILSAIILYLVHQTLTR